GGGPEMLAPKKRQAKAWTLVPHFARRTVSSASDASLRLTAQEDDEMPVSRLSSSSEMIKEDRGDAISAIRRTSGGITMRSSAVFASLGSFTAGSPSGPRPAPARPPITLP